MTSVRTSQRWFVLLALVVFALAVVAANHNFAASQAQAAAQADLQPPGPSAAPPETLPVVLVAETGFGYPQATLVQAANLDLIAMWKLYGPISQSISTDDGASWSVANQVGSESYGTPRLTRTLDNTLWSVFSYDNDLWYRTSSDNGGTWSDPTLLDDEPGYDSDPDITQTTDGRLWVVWSSWRSGTRTIWYKRSDDGGASWSSSWELSEAGSYSGEPTIAQAGNGVVWVVWDRGGDLWYRSTDDSGASWSAEASLGLGCCHYGPRLAVTGDGMMWLAFRRNDDVWYRHSANNGVNWSLSQQFTRFTGPDVLGDLAPLAGNRVGVVWGSNRSGTGGTWFGIMGEREDINPPPYVAWIDHSPGRPDGSDVITFRAWASDETGVASVHLVWTLNGVAQPDLLMYDDGLHGDYGSNDGIYGVLHPPLSAGSQVVYRARATDINGNTHTSWYASSFAVLEPFVQTSNVLLVPDAGGGNISGFSPYYTDALFNLGYSYDVWDTELRGRPPTSDVLNGYTGGVVIWSTPTSGYVPWGSVSDLQAYLDLGGKLFITGQNIAEHLNWYYPAFLANYLHAAFVQGDTGLYTLAGAAGDPIGNGLGFSISGVGGANNQYSKDEIDPLGGASVVLTYTGNEAGLAVQEAKPSVEASEPNGNISSGTGGLRVDTGTYRVVFFSFGFEGINDATDRSQVMERVVTWLGCSAAPGDFNCDGQVTTADLVLAAGAWGQPNARFDLDGDGEVTIVDIMLAAALWEG